MPFLMPFVVSTGDLGGFLPLDELTQSLASGDATEKEMRCIAVAAPLLIRFMQALNHRSRDPLPSLYAWGAEILRFVLGENIAYRKY